MPSPISRRPAGLLDLLLAQQQGQNPTDLIDSVSPTIDMLKFYEAERLDVTRDVKNVTAVGDVGAVDIPAGEYWKVLAIACNWVFATVNQRLGIRIEVKNIGETRQDLITSVVKTPTGATDEAAVALRLGSPVIFPSGTTLQSRASSLALDGEANIQLTTTVFYVRMEA